MISSPPEEAEHIRGKTLTPESPKPVHYPSPSNIPILEKQMDPMFHEPPAPSQPYTQVPTPSAQSSASLYVDQQTAPSYQNVGAQGASDATVALYPQSGSYAAYNTQSQDNPSSIQTYPSQNQAPASSYSETNSASYQDSRPAYPSSYDPNAYAAHQPQAHPPAGAQYQSQASSNNGGVNYQALLDSLTPTTEALSGDRYGAPSLSAQPSQSQNQAATSSLPAAPNLPPRPPPQDKNATNFNANDDIRSYHPHSQKPTSNQPRGNAQLQPLNVRGGDGHQGSASRSNQSPSTPAYSQRQSVDVQGEIPDDEDSRWPAEVNRLYEEFLEDERRYVTDGQWDQFPNGSRLFIGNLPTEKVTKRDIFHRFFRHGKLAQISIKQAYGFVQFLDAGSCQRALQAEQGQAVRGRKMHLEISKPQRNTRKNDNDRGGAGRRRSRSPDYSRGGTAQSRNGDRYTGNGKAMSPRDNRRYRDDYRGRSPTPPRGGRGNRGRDRSRDWYDGRRRSRSRSPRRYRSPSPRRDTDDLLPLPHRKPHEIPDVQVLVVNEGLPSDYIRWVEGVFAQHGLKADVLILSPRLSEEAVVRRQILEGVLAIVRLNTSTLNKAKVNLQVFDRRAGASNVTFNEYADLDPSTAAALVINVKQTQTQTSQLPTTQAYANGYGAPPVAPVAFPNVAPPAAQYTNPMNAAPDFSTLLSTLGQNGLTQLLGAFNQSKPAQQPAAAATPDLTQLLQSITASQQQSAAYGQGAQTQLQTQPQTTGQTLQNLLQNPALASLLGGQAPAQPPSASAQPPASGQPAAQPDMNEIMAQLAKYQR